MYKEIVRHQAATVQRRKCHGEARNNLESADSVEAGSPQQSSPKFVDTLTRENGTSTSLSSLLEMIKDKLREHGRDFARLEHAASR